MTGFSFAYLSCIQRPQLFSHAHTYQGNSKANASPSAGSTNNKKSFFLLVLLDLLDISLKLTSNSDMGLELRMRPKNPGECHLMLKFTPMCPRVLSSYKLTQLIHYCKSGLFLGICTEWRVLKAEKFSICYETECCSSDRKEQCLGSNARWSASQTSLRVFSST